MKFFVISKNGVILDLSYQSLKAVCDAHGLGYSMALRGRRTFLSENEDVYVIKEVSIVKMKKRGVSGFK